MATLPPHFRKATPGKITNYGFADVITGKAYLQLYAGTGENNNTLLGFQFDSSDILTEADGDTGDSMTKEKDIDFDIEFETTQQIEGTAIINITHGVQGASAPQVDSFLIVKLIHVDATPTETILATKQTPTIINAPNPEAERYAIDLDIAKTDFKRGEKLRLTVELWVDGSDAGVYAFFCHDPNGRAPIASETNTNSVTDSHDTSLNLWIPFNPIL